MSDPLDEVEAGFHLKLPPRHRAALLDVNDPIHACTILLRSEGDATIFSVNQGERASDWREWPDYLVAFAYDGCFGLFAYDTRQEPYRVYYIDPLESATESVTNCETEGYVFRTFDDWYANQLSGDA
ncbi:MAG: hypothetical protein U0840_27445 [Gemmataceae bacterium]